MRFLLHKASPIYFLCIHMIFFSDGNDLFFIVAFSQASSQVFFFGWVHRPFLVLFGCFSRRVFFTLILKPISIFNIFSSIWEKKLRFYFFFLMFITIVLLLFYNALYSHNFAGCSSSDAFLDSWSVMWLTLSIYGLFSPLFLYVFFLFYYIHENVKHRKKANSTLTLMR